MSVGSLSGEQGDPRAGSTGPGGYRAPVGADFDRMRTVTTRAATSLLRPRGVRGVATEAAWLTTHLAMYPWGLAEERARTQVARHTLTGLGPVQRGLVAADVVAAGTPIILVHGVVDNRSVFSILRRTLRRRGFDTMVSVNYSPLTDDIRRVAHRLAYVVADVTAATGYEQVHLVGHSMGGLIARYYVQRLGGSAHVHTVVTLGSPHAGTQPARLVPHPVFRQMRPGSSIIREFDQPAPGCATRFLAVWSDLDQVIVPKRNARLIHPDLNARNVFVRGVGHMSLPVDRRVRHEIYTTLARLDRHGVELPTATQPAGYSFSTGA